MKKILLFSCIILSLFCIYPKVFAENVDLNYLMSIAKANNIDIAEAQKLPYIGKSYEQVKSSKTPSLMVFVDFTDIPTATRYINNGYFVYNNLQHDYGFAIFNVKNSDNAALIKKFKVKSVPYVLVANPSKNEVLPIKSSLYDNPKRMVYLLRTYLGKTR